MYVQLYEEKFMRFYGGKTKALTLSYDDGGEADKRLVQIFNSRGLKCTFNLNSARFNCPEWHKRMNERDTLSLFRSAGQEVAMHGNMHVFMDKVPLAEAVREAALNREYLEKNFNTIVRGMAYSYGAYNDDIKRVLRDLGVVYARTTNSTHDFSLPKDFMEWNPTCHHTEEELAPLSDRFFEDSPLNEKKHREPWLFYLWGHSFEFDENDNWEIIESFAARAAANAKDIWFATNMEIYRYISAYKALEFSFDGERAYNPSAIPVWLELRGMVYELPAGKTVCFGK